ncbi:hypothetical protein BDV96DRAFT_629809 [Lophiotrema nucula]|uniref:Rhodopsin domain-containing protein n=1 Tax=Lophiotrema nucula TaxID=690887 RepID=A0A6A5ZGK4_9PLEO|nr:hypothetical protein BDV96DRAFT_629809 [Lophiotrema nucula]
MAINDYRSTLNIVGWVLAATSTVFIAARLFTRTRISTTSPGWDDWFMLIAWVWAIVCTSTVTVGTTYGFGQHIGDIPNSEDQAHAAMYVLIAPLFSLASAFFTKTSIIIAFMRIMGRTVTWVHKLIAYVPIVLLLLTSMLSCGVMIFFCWPVQKAWRPTLDGTCMDPKVLDIVGRSVSAYNAAMDVFCALVPYLLIRNLNIPRKDKRNLIILMGGSIFGAVATIMKIVAMSTISNVGDITYSWSEITIWYLTENHVLIITGSMPALRPFWRTIYGRYSSYVSSSKSRNSFNPSSSNKKSESYHLPTIGSARNKANITNPYSVAMRDESSEESLETRMQRNEEDKREREAKKGQGDTESVEVILPKRPDGVSKARVTSGKDSGDGRDKRNRKDSDARIFVTTEVQVV